ncbi:MAG TPA: Fe-Mn family superoxide dismutase [Verrucomicrobiae bacterium]|jgi:Fe-Mn family superoxide dismutase|nr:Fe-Mn family superoxide dismutase [Verrucomicrobiae bacterium]
MNTYTPKKWDLAGLKGISDATLEMHFGLYEGYVKNTNLLIEKTQELRLKGEAAGSNPVYAELTRRMGWEFNGMRLHELYFDNMTKAPKDLTGGKLYNLLGQSYGDFETWKKDFFAVGGMRGVGWAIAFYDPQAKQISNHWIELHQDGNLASFVPIVVMDCWEHAFIKDYRPSERGKYIEAFYSNLNWGACESRLA